MKKEQMQPGKRYKGYGFINEFKEFQFIPEDTGSRAGREKCILEREGLRITETKNLIIVKFNLEKQSDKTGYIREFSRLFNEFTNFVNKYEV